MIFVDFCGNFPLFWLTRLLTKLKRIQTKLDGRVGLDCLGTNSIDKIKMGSGIAFGTFLAVGLQGFADDFQNFNRLSGYHRLFVKF